jgi:transcriptional regulator with XRE-family HTH domain
MADKSSVGAKIAQIRETRNLSVDQLAERAQLAPELLEQIEGGELIPSLTPLMKIARVLGVRLGTFMDDVQQIGPVVNRKGQLKQTVRFAGGFQPAKGELDLHALALDKAGRHMDPFIVEVLPASDKDYQLSSHEGEEFIYVLGGRIEISYGKDVHVLEEGDSIYYDSIVAHHLHALGDVPAKILAVVYAPF